MVNVIVLPAEKNDAYVMVIVKYTFVVYFPKGTRLFWGTSYL